jgi:predicted acyltransferase (DUF342 family)
MRIVKNILQACKQIGGNSGFTLVYIIAGMLVLSILGIGLYTMTSSTSLHMVQRMSHDQVVLLAQSGLNHAEAVAKVIREDDSIIEKAEEFKTKVDEKSYSLGAGEFHLSVDNIFKETGQDKVIVTSTAELSNVSFSLSDDFIYSTGGGGGEEEFALSSPNSNQVLNNNNFVDGNIHGKDVTLGNQSEVTGDVIATGNVTLVNHSEVGGGICATGNVDLQNHTSVAEDIHSFGNVTLGANNSEVSGSIFATGNVTLLNGSEVQGDIHAGGNVTLGSNNSRVHGSIYAAGNVTLQHKTSVDSNVHAGGNVELTTQGTIQGNVIAGGSITLADRSVIEGNATAGISIDHGRQTQVEGTETITTEPNPTVPTAPTTCPQICMPDHTSISPGTDDINVTWENDWVLSPSSYRNLTLGGRNNLYLSGGNYYFESISTGTRPSLYLDLSSSDINIFVHDNVHFGDELKIHVNSGTGGYQPIIQGNNLNETLKPLAAKVYLETLGSFSMSNQNEWFGTIYAKNNISFSNNNLLVGSYQSSSGEITPANQMEVYFVQSNYARDTWDYSCD